MGAQKEELLKKREDDMVKIREAENIRLQNERMQREIQEAEELSKIKYKEHQLKIKLEEEELIRIHNLEKLKLEKDQINNLKIQNEIESLELKRERERFTNTKLDKLAKQKQRDDERQDQIRAR